MKTSFNELKARNILSKEQMQNVKGGVVITQGDGNGTCGIITGERFPGSDLQCETVGHNKYGYFVYGISKADALAAIQGIPGARWCCDSCGSVSWFN